MVVLHVFRMFFVIQSVTLEGGGGGWFKDGNSVRRNC